MAEMDIQEILKHLPQRYPILMIDRVLQCEPGKRIVIDGVVYDSGEKLLPLLDPSLIERVEVIKGPAAAAIYGERAANGVIVITTKKR